MHVASVFCAMKRLCYNCFCAAPVACFRVGEWLSLVEHLVRDQGVGGSNPLSPTILFLHLRLNTKLKMHHYWCWGASWGANCA